MIVVAGQNNAAPTWVEFLAGSGVDSQPRDVARLTCFIMADTCFHNAKATLCV